MTKIVYKDIAPGSAEDATFSATGQTSFSTLELSNSETIEPYITLEHNLWALDGTHKPLGSNTVHYWSTALSKADCTFTTNPTITTQFTQQFSSVGITLMFADENFCTSVNIKWYQGSTLKANADFAPTSSTFFCSQTVTAYNKVVITLKATNLPNRRARLSKILFGLVREFGEDELRSVSVTNETNLLSSELPDSELNWTIDSASSVAYMFQLRQPVEVYSGNNLIGVYYIKTSSRRAASIYDITAKDAIGQLEDEQFSGGVYLSGVSAMTLVSNIVGSTFNVTYETGVTDMTLKGLLVAQSKREALQQVLFAWGKCCRTDGGEDIKIFVQSNTPTTIDTDHTYEGVSITQKSMVTKVNVTAHTYTQSSSGSIEVLGNKYEDTKTVYSVSNPNVTASDKQNVVEVTDATLIATTYGQAVAQRVYDYYQRRNTHNSRIVLDGEKIGDCVTQPTPWNTTVTGNIYSMRVTLSNISAADVESLGVAE